MNQTQRLTFATFLMDKVAQITESHPSTESMLKGQSQVPPHKTVDESTPVDSYVKSATQHNEKFLRRRRLLATLLPALLGGGYGALAGGMAPARAQQSVFDVPERAGLPGALAGGAIGALAGGGVGYGASKAREWAGLDPLAFTVANAKNAYVKDPQDMTQMGGNLNELRKLVSMVDANPSKLSPAEDVLSNNSITVPKGVVGGAAGAAGGALAGGALGSLLSGSIDPQGTEEEAAGKRRTRHIGAGVGGALGLLLASHKDIGNSDMIQKLRQKFAI